MRGMLDLLAREPVYKDSAKDWYVELVHSTYFWYDLIVNPPRELDSRKEIKKHLKSLQAAVESELDKRFIYFLAARKKIRFCLKRPPRYSADNELVLFIEVGREKKIRRISLKIFDLQTSVALRPAVAVTDKIITFQYSAENIRSFSIHDFMSECRLGFDTEIHYVGYTKNPSDRPINRIHRGLADTFYNVSNEEYDFFVYYNLFKVTSVSSNSRAGINFCVANSMIDEVNVDLEGKIVEKALILYFQTAVQRLNRQREHGEFQNNLIKLIRDHNINTITMHLESDPPSEYYRFFSKVVPPSDIHLFKCAIHNDALVISNGSHLYDEAYGPLTGS